MNLVVFLGALPIISQIGAIHVLSQIKHTQPRLQISNLLPPAPRNAPYITRILNSACGIGICIGAGPRGGVTDQAGGRGEGRGARADDDDHLVEQSPTLHANSAPLNDDRPIPSIPATRTIPHRGIFLCR